MSGTLSKYVLEDDEIRCFYPNMIHCPVKCMSRSYAHLYVRFQNMEQTIGDIKTTLDTVVDYIARETKSSSSSDSERSNDKKKAKKKSKSNTSPIPSRSGSGEANIDQELADTQVTLERDFAQLLTWKDSDDEGGKPKKPKRCQVVACLKSRSNSSSDVDGDTSELESSEEEQEPAINSEAEEIVRKVSKVIDDMAKVVDEIEVTAGIAVQVAADADELQKMENGSHSEEEEEEEHVDEESDPEIFVDFLALYNEMNEVD